MITLPPSPKTKKSFVRPELMQPTEEKSNGRVFGEPSGFCGTDCGVNSVQLCAERRKMRSSPFNWDQRQPALAKIEPNIYAGVAGSVNTLRPEIARVTVSDAVGIDSAKQQVRVNAFNWWQRKYFQHIEFVIVYGRLGRVNSRSAWKYISDGYFLF
jgi:hypothetical protein